MEDVKKKLIRNLIIIGGIFVLIFIILILFQGCGNKKVSYEKIEDKLKLATEKYLTKTNLFPSVEGEYVTISSDVLISNGYLKKFESMTSDKNCFGQVLVQNNSKKYNYIVYLTCDNYKTKTIKDEITSKVVDNGDGVYNINNEYIYRGEYVDNYIKLSDKTYRIIKITDDGYLKLISESAEENDYVWDNRYDISTDSYDGINNYEKSRLRENILKIFEKSKTIDHIKDKIVTRPICVGKRDKTDLSFNNFSECELKLEGDYLSLIGANDVALASIDKNCTNIKDKSCANYNYFKRFFTNSWTTIGVTNTTSKVYYVSGIFMNEKTCADEGKVYIVIYINGNEKLKSGNGSKDKPYTI